MNRKPFDPTDLRMQAQIARFVAKNGQDTPFSELLPLGLASFGGHQTEVAFVQRKGDGARLLKGVSGLMLGPGGEPLHLEVLVRDRHRHEAKATLVAGTLMQTVESEELSDKLDRIIFMLLIGKSNRPELEFSKKVREDLQYFEGLGARRMTVSKQLVEQVRELTEGSLPIFAGLPIAEAKKIAAKLRRIQRSEVAKLNSCFVEKEPLKPGDKASFAAKMNALERFAFKFELGGVNIPPFLTAAIMKLALELRFRVGDDDDFDQGARK